MNKYLSFRNLVLVSLLILSSVSCDKATTQGLSDGSIHFNGIDTVERTLGGAYLLIWQPSDSNKKIKYEVYSQEIGEVIIQAPAKSTPILSINNSRTAFKAQITDEVNPYKNGKLIATVEGGDTSFQLDQSFKPKTSYAFQVKAVSDDQIYDENQTIVYMSATENSDYTGCVSATPVSGSEIQIEIEFPLGASEVEIFRDEISVFKTQSASVITFLDKKLSLDKKYKYKCIATTGNDIWIGKNQPELFPKNPFIEYKGCLNATVIGINTQIDFQYPEDADEVVLYRDELEIYTSNSKAGTSFIDQNLVPGKTYAYTCEARKDSIGLKGFNIIKVKIPDPLESYKGCLSAISLGSSSIRVELEFPEIAENVSVLRNGVEIFSTPSKGENIFTDTGLNEAQIYKYSCVARVGNFSKVGSEEIEVSTLSTNPPTFQGISNVEIISSSEVNLKWGVPSSSGVSAAYFNIYLSTGQSVNFSDKPYKVISAGSISTVLDKLGDDMEYSFAIRACSIEDICDNNTKSIQIIMPDGGAPKTIGALNAVIENGKVKISAPWTHNNGAMTKREVWRKEGENAGTVLDTYTKVKTITVADITNPDTTIYVGNIIENVKYHFIIVDIDKHGNPSSVESVATILTGDLTPPSFSGIGAVNKGEEGKEHTSLNISFTAATVETPSSTDGASHYLVYLKKLGGDACQEGILKSEIPAQIYPSGQVGLITITELDEKTLYSICMKAKDSSGNISNTSTYLTKSTLDLTPPDFDGVQFAAYNKETSTVDIGWNPSTSNDVTEYRVKLWKNTLTPSIPEIETFYKNSTSFANGLAFKNTDFSFLGGDTLYILVDACDNAATIIDGQQNCSDSPLPLTYKVPDVTPPQGFLGIDPNSNNLISNVEGNVDIYWKTPNDWNDYRGFKVYSVESVEDPIDDSDLVFLKDCPCASKTCADQPNNCKITGLNPYRTYIFHVRAYDSNGNLTTYLSADFASTSKRIIDTTPPVFNSGLSLSYEPGMIHLQFADATDSQYELEPGSKITYRVYRRQGQTFTNPTNPNSDGDAVLLTNTYSSEYTDNKLLSNVNFFYAVCAEDASGNRKCDGNVKNMVTPDVEPPTIEVFGSTKDDSSEIKIWDLRWKMSDNSDTEDLSVTIKKLVTDIPSTPNSESEYLSTVASTNGMFPDQNGYFYIENESGPANVNKYIHYLLKVKDLAGNETTSKYTLHSTNEVLISAIKRNFGSTTGGKFIVVEGEGFVDGMNIKIGDLNCLNIKFYHRQAAGCYTPSQTEGAYTVSVSMPGNTGQAVLPSGYSYVNPDGPNAGLCDLASSSGSDFPEGSGSKTDPYKICNGAQLDNIRNIPYGRKYILSDNVDLSSYTNNSFLPIVASNSWVEYYTGIDGNGLYIASFHYHSENEDYVGLFKRIENDESYVKNLNLVDFNVTGRQYVGTLAGMVHHYDCSATITNSTFQGTVNGSGSTGSTTAMYGGVVGQIISGSIDNNKAFVKVNTVRRNASTEYYVGGFSGAFGSWCTANNLHVEAEINSEHTFTGGVFGNLGGTIQNSYFNGKITLNGNNSSSSGLFLGAAGGSTTDPAIKSVIKDNIVRGKLIATQNQSYLGAMGRNHYNVLVERNDFDFSILGAKDSIGGIVGLIYTSQNLSYLQNTVNINIESTGSYVGGLLGQQLVYNLGGSINIEKNIVKGIVRGYSQVGGMIGRLYDCHRDRCQNVIIEKNLAESSVIGVSDSVGGFIGLGYSLPAQVVYRQNVAKGNVTSPGSCVGGFGGITAARIEDSRSEGIVTGGDRSGSFIGCLAGHADAWQSSLARVFATGAVIKGTGTSFGGLIGYLYEDASYLDKIYESSFWDKNTTELDTSFGDSNQFFPLTTANAMKKATFESAGWIFTPNTGTWKLPFENKSYPKLQWED